MVVDWILIDFDWLDLVDWLGLIVLIGFGGWGFN